MTDETSENRPIDGYDDWNGSPEVSPSSSRFDVLLFMPSGRNRQLLATLLRDRYAVTTTNELDDHTDFDLCIVDEALYRENDDRLHRCKDRSGAVFLPILLTVREQSTLRTDPDVWETVDDVVSMPIRKVELQARVESLVSRREESLQLLEREKQLEATLEDLEIKDRAIDQAPIGITITDASTASGDNPILHVNDAFEALTGYDEGDAVGRDCRFLQGPKTDADTVAELRTAIDEGRPTAVDIRNYTNAGRQFWNNLTVAPVRAAEDCDEITHFVGFQQDVSNRVITEQRLEVLNRVLRHNLRNEMSIIKGYAEILREQVDDSDLLAAVRTIIESSEDLLELGGVVYDVEKTLRKAGSDCPSIDVESMVARVANDAMDAWETDTITVTVTQNEPPPIPGQIEMALRQAIESALSAAPETSGTLEITVTESPDIPDGVEICLVDHEQRIPETDLDVVRLGEETQLAHADGVDLWLVKWLVQGAGGTLDIDDADGTIKLTMRVPPQAE